MWRQALFAVRPPSETSVSVDTSYNCRQPLQLLSVFKIRRNTKSWLAAPDDHTRQSVPRICTLSYLI